MTMRIEARNVAEGILQVAQFHDPSSIPWSLLLCNREILKKDGCADAKSKASEKTFCY